MFIIWFYLKLFHLFKINKMAILKNVKIWKIPFHEIE